MKLKNLKGNHVQYSEGGGEKETLIIWEGVAGGGGGWKVVQRGDIRKWNGILFGGSWGGRYHVLGRIGKRGRDRSYVGEFEGGSSADEGGWGEERLMVRGGAEKIVQGNCGGWHISTGRC